MKSFSDVYNEYFALSKYDLAKKMFEAGQQSKQAEVDELQGRIDICERLRDSQFEKLWNLTKAIQFARNGADEDFDLFLNHIDNILKGDQS